MRNTLLYLLTLLNILVAADALATHNRAGEITYRHLNGFTYEVTIFTCTDISEPTNADRQFMPIDWGDGSPPDSIERVLQIPANPTPSDTTKQNFYTATHTYPGLGNYVLKTEDPNRNGGVNNIPNSIDQVFSVAALLVISSQPSIGAFNNSVQLLNPPKGDACFGALWQHNAGAFDPDGDSLAYELVQCTGIANEPIPGFVFPDEFTDNNGELTIDPVTGTVSWEVPLVIGLYNFAFRISEYRQGQLVGYVVRDMQMSVIPCIDQPPVNDPYPDTCIVAGSTLSLLLEASDPNGDDVEMTVFGETFELPLFPSTFTQIDNDPPSGSFIWQPTCAEVRLEPYAVFVQSTDQGPPPALVDVDVFNVTVIAPPVTNLMTDVQSGGDIQLTWDVNPCENASGYKIYRRLNSNDYSPGHCDTGLPESEGYDLIAQTSDWTSNVFLDTDVPYGNPVCYRIVTCFPDGSESIVSDEVCDEIPRVKPVITKVSIGLTDAANGRDTLRWFAPTELDSSIFTGPYTYNIERSLGNQGFELVETVNTTALDVGEFEFIENGIDTESSRVRYRVRFANDGEALSSSPVASSVFLTSAPTDNAIQLTWDFQTPWVVDSSLVQVFDEGLMVFVDVAMVSGQSYLHDGLVNGLEYCHRIIAFGSYDADEELPTPLINYSQEVCASPFDNVEPCPPVIFVDGNCADGEFELFWPVPPDSCGGDIEDYNIYFTETLDGEFTLLETLTMEDFAPEDSIIRFTIPFEEVLGCFAVTALDGPSIRPDGSISQNESIFSDTLCIPSCPEYSLPNVITPNGSDGNDVFGPFLPYAYVDSVDMRIYNRWGGLVFQTGDPDIGWDGVHQDSGERVSDGTYFYVVTIFERRLEGLVPRDEAGTITVLDNRGVPRAE